MFVDVRQKMLHQDQHHKLNGNLSELFVTDLSDIGKKLKQASKRYRVLSPLISDMKGKAADHVT